MRTLFSDILNQLKGIWSRLDGGQRLVVSSVLLATVVGLGGMIWYAGQPSYEVVFSATSGEDLSTARRALDQSNIPYTYDDSGMGLLVDRSRVGAANSAINEAGLRAQGSSGSLGVSSIIDDSETKAWKLANASIAKAESAVREIYGVANVRITASPPRKRRAFVDKDRESRPTAAVLVALRPGTSFGDVARTSAALTSSQLGIPLENITVSNASGGQRWRHDPNRETGGGSSEFLTLQRNLSGERTGRAQEMLDQMWPNKTSVVVNVELDPLWEVISQKVLPTTELVRSEKTTSESTDQTSGGTPGVGGNTTGGNVASTKNETKNETKEKEYVTEIGERRSGRMAPDIKRITVAVLYDRSLEQSEGFSEEELTKVVKSMVGWDKDRDSVDGFSVLPGDFAPIDMEALMSSGPSKLDMAAQWGPMLGQILGVLVVVLFLRGLLKRSGAARSEAGTAESQEADPDKELTPEQMQRQMRREIERAIANDPAALAKLLETWLIEQKA